jgi:hypothetical protein
VSRRRRDGLPRLERFADGVVLVAAGNSIRRATGLKTGRSPYASLLPSGVRKRKCPQDRIAQGEVCPASGSPLAMTATSKLLHFRESSSAGEASRRRRKGAPPRPWTIVNSTPFVPYRTSLYYRQRPLCPRHRLTERRCSAPACPGTLPTVGAWFE